jgi:hypothetical protein
LDYALAISFLFLYYVRPYEWMEWLAPLQPVTQVLAAGLAVVFFQAARRVAWQPRRFVGEFLRTPLDWILLAFTLWVLHASGSPGDTWSRFYQLLAYYVLVQHALTSWRRVEGFLWVWLALILFVSIMGVLSTFDIDPFGSQSNTLGMYKGRLSINLSIFNNPNALGHSVVLILPMIYFLGIWRRHLLAKELSPLLFAMPAWCLYLTQSKGGFLSAAAGIASSQMVGRPKWFQVALITAIYVVGFSLLMFLPRMPQLESVRGDRGVQGRLLVWNFGWTSLQTLPNGLGYGRFTQFVPVYVEGKYRLRKPAHSSYVEVGAELGKKGLFLWLGILYYSLKSLVRARGRTDQEERIRRLLLCLTIIYMASSWMTNISYRGTFYIQLGVIAAFYRLMQRTPQPDLAAHGATSAAGLEAEIETITASPVALGGMPAPVVILEPMEATQAEGESPELRPLPRWLSWRRIAWLPMDAALIYVMYWVVLRAWRYFMNEWTGV